MRLLVFPSKMNYFLVSYIQTELKRVYIFSREYFYYLFNFSTNCTRICSKDNLVLSRNFSLNIYTQTEHLNIYGTNATTYILYTSLV